MVSHDEKLSNTATRYLLLDSLQNPMSHIGHNNTRSLNSLKLTFSELVLENCLFQERKTNTLVSV